MAVWPSGDFLWRWRRRCSDSYLSLSVSMWCFPVRLLTLGGVQREGINQSSRTLSQPSEGFALRKSFLSSNHLDAWDFLPCSSWKKHEVFVYSKRIRDMKQEESLCTPKPHLFASELSHRSHLYDRFCAAETWKQVDVTQLSIIWLNWTDR